MNNNQDYIVRCDRAGVFFGKIKERNGSEVTMTEVRKLWSWDGACAVEPVSYTHLDVYKRQPLRKYHKKLAKMYGVTVDELFESKEEN